MSLWNDGPFIPSNVTCKDAVPINFIIIIYFFFLDNSKWTTETHKQLCIKPFIVGK